MLKVINITDNDTENYTVSFVRNDGKKIDVLIPKEGSILDIENYGEGPFGLNLVTNGHYR